VRDLQVTAEQIKNSLDGERLHELIETFADIGRDDAGGVTRIAFSQEDLQARNLFIRIAEEELHLEVRLDPLGNIFARREGRLEDAPVIMSGSHLDSVRNGGKYDGPAGVFCALEAFRALDRLEILTQHPFELVVFSSEEPNPFGLSTFGSRGVAGKLKKEELLELYDDQGRSLRDAVAFLGGDLDRLQEAQIAPGKIAYFVELHIEQMAHLERLQKDIGIVTGITGIKRKHIRIEGEASHCGTTSMADRRDALCAAAELVLALEDAARSEQGRAVATIGRLNVFPNSINITPEAVEMDAEVRSFDPASIQRISCAIEEAARTIQTRRLVAVQLEELYATQPTHFSDKVRGAIQEAARFLGYGTLEEVSMAGHDAAHMTSITESGMIFIPCRHGVSHCPQEHTETENLRRGAQTLLKTLLILDQS